MANSSTSISVPEIHRRGFLGGTAAALAAMAVPAAAVAAGGASAEPDWQALGDELEALYQADRLASSEIRATAGHVWGSYRMPPLVHNISGIEGGGWTWQDEPIVLLLRRPEDRLGLIARINRHFNMQIAEAHAAALRENWPAGVLDRFKADGEQLRAEAISKSRAWLAECQERDDLQAEAERVLAAVDTRIEELEAQIEAAPTTSFAAAVVKLDMILRYSDDDLWTTSLTRKLRDELAAAAGLRLSA